MARYTKHTSTYIQRKRHQLIEGGSIIERDWTTIGERHVIEPGKRRVYSDSGFLFTESNKNSYKTRNRTDEWSETYTADSLSPTINDDVNSIKLPIGNDVRNYAYYGSAVEMLRASLENIAKWFPGKVWTENDNITRIMGDGTNLKLFNIISDGHHNFILNFDAESTITPDNLPGIYVLNNPFNLDFVRTGLSFTKYDNELRNIPYSWNRYYINGCKILTYDPWIKQYNECDEDYSVQYEVAFTYEVAPNVSKYNEFYGDYNADACTEFTDDITNEGDCLFFVDSDVTYKEGHIYGLKNGNNIIWCTDVKGFTLVPMPSVITSYFDNLDGFERLLLTKKSNPIYTCTLKTPVYVSDNEIEYVFTNRRYTFPSNGYCVVCNGIAYNSYVDNLYNLCEFLDEEFTDNIWRNMTHESIKNFDWTYHKDFEDGDAEDNIFGGTRLKDTLRIYGRFFDEIKRYVDGIKLTNCVTFDGNNNISASELSEKAQLCGWEVYSTKTSNTDNLILTDGYIDEHVGKKTSRWEPAQSFTESLDIVCETQPKWFPGQTANGVTQNDVDNNFMRLLTMCGPNIFSSKGTKHSIEKIYGLFGFGDDDFTITERFYTVTPVESDKICYVYVRDDNPDDTINYIDVSTPTISTLTDYVNSVGDLTENSLENITIRDEYYRLAKYTFKELCEFLNYKKQFVKNYENDPFSGIPIKEVTLGNVNYIVPYFSQDYIYDGGVQFQTNGGWGKFGTGSTEFDRNNLYGYSETLPYVQLVQNCHELLKINQYDITNGPIYYVIDISDITDFTEEDTSFMSHYFKIVDYNNPQKFFSWVNIPIPSTDMPDDYENYCNDIDLDTNLPVHPLYYTVTYDDYWLIQYLDQIVLDTKGNNPHTGNGKYDLGNDYLNYLIAPFYYSDYYYGFSEEYLRIISKMIRFEVSLYEGEKIVINNQLNTNYFLPNKVLIIKNNLTSYTFNDYFKKVIFKYLTQVIPSTTILIFC